MALNHSKVYITSNEYFRSAKKGGFLLLRILVDTPMKGGYSLIELLELAETLSIGYSLMPKIFGGCRSNTEISVSLRFQVTCVVSYAVLKL